MNGKREYGDYQTPVYFAQKICNYLKYSKKIRPTTVLEPTCGIGNFLESSLIFDANNYIGIDINKEYCEACRKRIHDDRVQIYEQDFFSSRPELLIPRDGHTLIVGNPPWVTSSTLSSLDSKNLPRKSNIKQLKGLDAITGASNFDICESIILQLADASRNTDTTIAMLCKTSVARNIFIEITRRQINYAEFEIVEFDAAEVFNINVSACMLYIRFSVNKTGASLCTVRNIDDIHTKQCSIMYVDGKLIRIEDKIYDDFDGTCCLEWRQGIKHDCSKVMELTEIDGKLYNAQHEHVDIERSIVFPLVKSSMFKKPIKSEFTKHVIVTQTMINESTYKLAESAPMTWAYLQRNATQFERRKSSIYKNAPPFAMFGVGKYAFATYKVGVSGFYKQPQFSLLFTNDKRPVMTDDTSYFLCFDTYEMAYVAMLILNNQRVQEFLKRIAFLDTKRPFTKRVLQRVDFSKIVAALKFEEIKQTEQNLQLQDYLSKQMYQEFSQWIGSMLNPSSNRQLSIFDIS